MSAPINTLSKKQLLWLYSHYCKHGHRYLDHYNCYEKESPPLEKVGFLDIEASNLKANFGILLSYCIKPAGSDDILCDLITKDDLDTVLDKRIVSSCIKNMRKFDRLVGHYSTRYDIPFLRTRAADHRLNFPTYGEIKHSDTYYMAKSKLCLSSNRQDVIAEILQHKNIKSRIDPNHWIKALRGDEDALAYILDHNKRDVVQLEKNYNRLIPYVKNIGKSI